MRPIRLTMQAFGPFIGSESIDFSCFGKQPLFLINGPTGAGKSTILDAMCFALYGSTTGADREAAHMRSDLTQTSDITEVEFEFALAQKRWRVRRVPLQTRPKARGDGETEQKPEAQLWRLDDEESETLLVPKSPVEVTRQIEELTGLNANQFRQVMVLPQGKFRELLLASSSEREKIFSTLFRTDIYKRVEESLKAQAADIRRRVENHQQKMAGVLETAGLENQESLRTSLNLIKQERSGARQRREESRAELQQAIEQRKRALETAKSFDRLAEVKVTLQQLEARSQDIESDKHRIAKADATITMLPTRNLWQDAVNASLRQQQLIEDLRIQLTTIEQQRSKEEKHHAQMVVACEILDEKKVQLNTIREQQRLMAQLVSKKEQVIRSKSESLALETKLSDAKKILKQKKILLDELEAKSASLHVIVEKLSHQKESASHLKQQVDKRISLESSRTRLLEIDKKSVTALEQLKQAASELEHSTREASLLESRWHKSQAAILAATLEDDKQCPVCGSVDHPEPANEHMVSDLVEKSDVDQARKSVETHLHIQHKADVRYGELKHEWTLTKQTLRDYEAELGDTSHLPLDDVKRNYAGAEEQLSELKLQKAQHETALRSLDSTRDLIRELDNGVKILSENYQDRVRHHAVLSAELTQALASIPEQNRDESVLDQLVSSAEQEIKDLIRNHENSSRSLGRITELEIAQKATFKSLQEQHRDLLEQIEIYKREWNSAIADSNFSDEQDFDRSRLDDAELEQIKQKVAEHGRRLSEVKGAIDQQQKAVTGLEVPDLIALEAQEKAVIAAHTEKEKNWDTVNSQYDVLRRAEMTLNSLGKSNEDFEKDYSIVGRLSDVANGKSVNRISLQRFVLSVLLDDVLLDASRRLKLMSNNRFELIRREGRSKGNKASGLELDVLDSHSGRQRPVSTLSGGESFLAALSLALGLSDVVQAYAGGIHLDSLFIDEGFGSLDQEALDHAVKTLIDLQAGGKMIGIISHVAEMKEQISMRLDVLPSATGSHVKLIY